MPHATRPPAERTAPDERASGRHSATAIPAPMRPPGWSERIAQSPRMVAQRQRTATVFGPAAAAASPLQRQPARGAVRTAAAWVAQRVHMPADSVGSLAGVMATKKGFFGRRELTGIELQAEILKQARKAGKAGGYRLGSYLYGRDRSLVRKPGADDEIHGMPALPDNFNFAKMDPWIKAFLIGTLADAGQLQYIADNADAIHGTHDVVIDVDCQFDRRGNVGFHKDSRGTTAFVNLTFTNKKAMQGADHYEDLEGDTGLTKKLPPEVQDDIRHRREAYAQDDTTDRAIKSPELPAHGRISFSDPNLYHSTPVMGHRAQPTGQETRDELIAWLSEHFDADEVQRQHIDTLRVWHRSYFNPYNRHGFEKLSEVSDTAYGKTESTAGRQRRLSVALDDHSISQATLDKQDAKPRTFIRTWVRFVPKS